MIKHGRDVYGPVHSPLFASVLDRRSMQLISKLWAEAYERNRNPIFLRAIEALLGYFERMRLGGPDGPIPASSTVERNSVWWESNVSLAVSLHKSMAKVPPELAARMKSCAEKEDKNYLKEKLHKPLQVDWTVSYGELAVGSLQLLVQLVAQVAFNGDVAASMAIDAGIHGNVSFPPQGRSFLNGSMTGSALHSGGHVVSMAEKDVVGKPVDTRPGNVLLPFRIAEELLQFRRPAWNATVTAHA